MKASHMCKDGSIPLPSGRFLGEIVLAFAPSLEPQNQIHIYEAIYALLRDIS